MVTQTTCGQTQSPVTANQVNNIFKRIDENKATEEEICFVRDLALRGITAPSAPPSEQTHVRVPDYGRFGYALAMRVLQSDLYRQLDERERAECDELIRAATTPEPK